jgi:hypothetical protein
LWKTTCIFSLFKIGKRFLNRTKKIQRVGQHA